MNIIEALDDPKVFGKAFVGDTWGAWKALLGALFGLPLDGEALEVFKACTGRSVAPDGGFNEAYLVCGRKAGKSFVLALIACYLAVFKNWQPYLNVGEVGSIMIIARDRAQARTIFRYIRGLLKNTPMLAFEVLAETATSLTLRHNIVIEVHTASFSRVRGYTAICCLCDEAAFWVTDQGGADPDTEIVVALKAAMATVQPHGMLLVASSPYAKRGVLWQAHRDHYGQDDSRVLVWQAATTTMNPKVSQAFVDGEIAANPSKNRAEYLAVFRDDVTAFVSAEAIAACVVAGRRELPPISTVRYWAAVDPSGGSQDSMTLCIGHREGETVVIDALRERMAKFSPKAVVKEFAAVLKAYGISRVVGDRYAGEWPREMFRDHGITYDLTEKSASDLFAAFLPLVNSARVELLDHERTVTQFCRLECKPGVQKDAIRHEDGGHDDLAVVVAAVAYEALNRIKPVTREAFSPNLADHLGGGLAACVDPMSPWASDHYSALEHDYLADD